MYDIIKSKIKSFFDIHTVEFKTTILIIIMIYLMIILSIALKQFKTTDIIPEVKAINTEVLKTFGPFTVKLNTGMFIKNFPVFNVEENKFLIEAVLWFEFNPEEIMLETVEKFSFDQGVIKQKSSPDIKIFENRVFVKYSILFEINSDLTFKYFPFNSHRLPIVLSNNFVTPEEMYFAIDRTSFQMQDDIIPRGWELRDTHVDAGYMELPLDEQNIEKKDVNPKALFVINFANDGLRKIMTIFIPMLALIFFCLFSFVLNISDSRGRSGLAIGAVTGLLGYRFVIERVMPETGYFTMTDALYLFFLVFIFAGFLMQLLIARKLNIISGSKDSRITLQTLDKISDIIFFILSFLLVIVTTYILLM